MLAAWLSYVCLNMMKNSVYVVHYEQSKNYGQSKTITQENPTQLNTDKNITKKPNTNVITTQQSKSSQVKTEISFNRIYITNNYYCL